MLYSPGIELNRNDYCHSGFTQPLVGGTQQPHLFLTSLTTVTSLHSKVSPVINFSDLYTLELDDESMTHFLPSCLRPLSVSIVVVLGTRARSVDVPENLQSGDSVVNCQIREQRLWLVWLGVLVTVATLLYL